MARSSRGRQLVDLKLNTKWRKLALPIASAVFAAMGLTSLLANTFSQTQSTPALIASRDLPEGTELRQGDVQLVNIATNLYQKNYLQHLSPGLVLEHSVSKSQLIPRNVITQSAQTLIPLRLTSLAPLPSTITVGDHVDLWAGQAAQNQTTDPEPIAYDAIVTSVENQNSMGQSTSNVEIRIRSDYLSSTLAAIDSNYKISVILHETLADQP